MRAISNRIDTMRWIIPPAIIAFIFYVDFGTDLFPSTYRAKVHIETSLKNHRSILIGDLERERLLVRNIERVVKENEILQHQWLVAKTLLPEQGEFADFLIEIDRYGIQSGIVFERFRALDLDYHGAFCVWPFAVQFRGEYHQMGTFFSRIANSNRIVNISNLRVHKTVVSDNGSGPGSVTTTALLTLYCFDPHHESVCDTTSRFRIMLTLTRVERGVAQEGAAIFEQGDLSGKERSSIGDTSNDSSGAAQLERARINAVRANEFFYQSFGRTDPFSAQKPGSFRQISEDGEG